MHAFMAAYITVWAAVSIYVWRMALRQRRLEREFEAVRSRWEQCEAPTRPSNKAA